MVCEGLMDGFGTHTVKVKRYLNKKYRVARDSNLGRTTHVRTSRSNHLSHKLKQYKGNKNVVADISILSRRVPYQKLN